MYLTAKIRITVDESLQSSSYMLVPENEGAIILRAVQKTLTRGIENSQKSRGIGC